MSVKKEKFSPLVIAGLAVLLIAVGGGGYILYRNLSDSRKSEPTDVEKIKVQKKESVEAARKVKAPDTVADEDKPATSRSVEISSLSQQTDQIVVQTRLIDVPSGSCELTATNGAVTVVKKASVIYQADFSTCAGFAISRQEFASAGEWSFSLITTYNGAAIKSAAKTLTIQ